MNSFQRLIKYLAMAFAIFLAVGIISLIASIIFNIVPAISGRNLFNDDIKLINYDSKEMTGVESLDIRNSAGNLYIKTGDTFRVTAENVSEDFSAKVSSSGKLTVEDKGYGFTFLWFNFSHGGNSKAKITVYLPESFTAGKAKINNGIGYTQIDALKADKLDINAGTGNIKGSSITAGEAEIEGGVGAVSLTDVDLNNTELKCGVGEIDINGQLTGDNKIECGVGNVSLNLKGNQTDYSFNVHPGVGTVRLNGSKISEKYNTGNNARNSLRIDGGVGTVNIDFIE